MKVMPNVATLMMCGICTELFDPDTMEKENYDGTGYVVKGDGQSWIGSKEIPNIVYTCNRCNTSKAIGELALSKDGRY